MTHTIQNAILILNYDNAIEEAKNTIFANTIANFKTLIEEKQLKGVFISLRNMTYPKETLHLEHLIKLLSKVSQKITVPIAFGDYSKALFHLLQPLSAQTSLKLFQNINTAILFLNPKSFKKDLSILLFEEETTNADKLSIELGKLGYTIIHAKDMEDFKHKASLKNYDMTITQNAFNLSQ
ncbi:MAG: chemotaxis protein CheX, partial [Sulfurospirillaceae bacterium]|nr:chemotaxis protein CheX [Sulfurospirillaceae bacterium]